jgi:dethiobiotin synthetase
VPSDALTPPADAGGGSDDPRRPRGCLVTGTDTGVGKSVLAAAIVARLREQGQSVRAVKPLITGLDEEPDPDWPPDHELLARVSGQTPAATILYGFGPPVSPHLAAELAGAQLPPARELAAAIRAQTDDGSLLIVEGVGGLLVPIGPEDSVRDLASALGLPLIVAARPGLGTINHTLLTLEVARAARLKIAAVVLTPWPAAPDTIERSNRDTIERLGNVEVATLPAIERLEMELLAAAGRELPIERWMELSGSDRGAS